ncbi:MAG: hypothetical protein LVQ95_02260 [Candidatus Micrarchaeales archaeon]|nr:hypothetical protein [Candidatus Micrarchaeales archaeon]
MAKKVTEGDTIRVGWDYNNRKKSGEIPAIFIHYKDDDVVYANEETLGKKLLAKMDEVDKRLGRPTRPREVRR